MSQPASPLVGTTPDPLSPITQDVPTQSQFDELFRDRLSEQLDVSYNIAKVLDDRTLAFDDGSVLYATSSKSSIIPTPNFRTYGFDQRLFVYPSPRCDIPHPCPNEEQQTLLNLPIEQRSLHIRPRAKQVIRPELPLQGYTRRRSLSHGDEGYRATSPPKPTFIRLQLPRARSATLEERTRPRPYPKHGRSRSHGPCPRGRPRKGIMPQVPLASTLGGCMILTHIGTPLDEYDSASPNTGIQSQGQIEQPIAYTYADDPQLHRMIHPAQLAHSRRIIEIGAMAIREKILLDSQLEDEDICIAQKGRVTKMKEVKHHVKQNQKDDEHVSNGCMIIQDGLDAKSEMNITAIKIKDGGREGLADALEAPSKMMPEDDTKLFDICLEEYDMISLLNETV
ncbi:hypothetical protein GQ44DRAFT_728048 [Phaeosphaeriaceae sp. PMI808]|nr:hypothetical protein GQ44DRAFT_728048 [Phaeosphaeriaceae sp. PMI808]